MKDGRANRIRDWWAPLEKISDSADEEVDR